MRALRAAATLSIVTAALLTWAAVSARPELNVPPAVALLGAAAFAAAGSRMVQMIFWPQSSEAGLAAVIALLLGLIGRWIVVGSGDRTCSAGWMSSASAATGLQCRVPFGIASIGTLLTAAYASRQWWVGRTKRE